MVDRATALAEVPGPNGAGYVPYSPLLTYEPGSTGAGVKKLGQSAGIIGLGGNDYFKVEDLSEEAAAIVAAVDGQKIVYGRKSYDRTSPLVLPPKSIEYVLDGAKMNMLANQQAIYARSGITGLFALSANYVPGTLELTINVTSGVLSDYYRRGAVAKIVSNAVDPTNRNEGAQANQWRVGEWFLVYDIDDDNDKLILAAPLKYWQGLDGQLTPPDAANRAVVESYTTANNARVFTPVDASIAIIGGDIEYEEGHEGVWSAVSVDLAGWHGVHLDGLRIRAGYGMGIATTCYGAVLNDIRVDYLADFARVGGSASLGYGIGDGGSGTTISSPRIFNTRHPFSTTGSSGPVDSASVGILLGWGKTANSSIIGGIAGGQMSSVWDTHSGADNISFVDCVAQDGLSYGFHARGRNIRFVRPVSKCRLGIQALVEWQSNGGADLPGPSGKGRGALTSCYIDSPVIFGERAGLTAIGATIYLEGQSSIECGAHDAIRTPGGGLIDIIGGSHAIRINGKAQASDDVDNRGIFTGSDAPAEFGITGFKGTVVRRAARVSIDAAAAVDGAAMRLFDGEPGTSLEVQGGLSAVLNNSFDKIEGDGGGTLIVDQFADWSISGTTATREPFSYFHTYPDGSKSGSGRVVALADDGVTFITLPVDSGLMELVGYDNVVLGGTALSLGLLLDFADPTGSTSERSSLIAGNATYVEVVDNVNFSTPGTDGKLCLSNYDSGNTPGFTRIYINNRLGAAISFHWVLRAGNVQGA